MSIVSLDGGKLLPLHFSTALLELFQPRALFVSEQLKNREDWLHGLGL